MKLTSAGPVFFAQRRVGHQGRISCEEGPMGPRIAQPRHFAERASTVLYALVGAGLVIALILAALFLVVLVIRAALHG